MNTTFLSLASICLLVCCSTIPPPVPIMRSGWWDCYCSRCWSIWVSYIL